MFRAPTISIKDLIQQGSESWNKAFQSFHGCQPGACSLLQQGKGLKKNERDDSLLQQSRQQEHKASVKFINKFRFLQSLYDQH
jgi:hypothetical protein